MTAACRMYVDLPPMFGPVMTSRRRSGDTSRSFAMNSSICRSTTGCRPPRIARPVAATNSGTREIERLRAFRQRRQHVERRERRTQALQRRNRGREVGDERFVEHLLPRERAVLRGKRAILERLQFRRDVALRVLERLPAPVVVGNLLHVGVRDLDVEPVHAVVFDLEIGDAGARAFARLPARRGIRRTCRRWREARRARRRSLPRSPRRREPAPRVPPRWRASAARPTASRPPSPARAWRRAARRIAASAPAIAGTRAKRVAQPRQIAGSRRSERDARGDALDVRGARELLHDAPAARRRR